MKYNNTKTIVKGIKFDSILESQAYLLLTSKGLNFDLQPKIVLQEKFKGKQGNVRAITYIPDFVVYFQAIDGVVEKHYIDIKGMETAVFKLKRILFFKHLENEKYSYFYTVKTISELNKLFNNW